MPLIRLAVSLLAFVLVTLPLGTYGQAPKVPRVGVLSTLPAPYAAPYVEAGKAALRDAGYIEGQNIVVEYRFAGRSLETLQAQAAELVALKVDVLVVVGDLAIRTVQKATTAIPIIMVSGGDPVASGYVASVARPGGNITGMSSLLPEMDAKLLALLKETVPKATRVAVLWNPNSHGGVLGFKEMQAAAPGLKVTLLSIEVRKPDELEAAYAAITAQKADGLLVITDPITFGNRGQIIEFAAKHRLPAMYEVREFVNEGGLMSYGPSLVAMIRRVPVLLDKILKGTKPADIPVEQPTQFEMVVNEKSAKAIGLAIPPPVLVRADAVIR
jgi:putative tryptophan/tyrosine transport system substrate-binding protein